MTPTYDCIRHDTRPPRVIRGFINISTGQPASCDTAVSLTWEGADLVVCALCHSDTAGVSAADRLIITFDPVGREADKLQLAIAPDGALSSALCGMTLPGNHGPWAADPYPFPAGVETALTNDGWRALVRLPLAHMFALGGGAAPTSFRLNVGRVMDNREWSYWPLANATFGESLFAFPLIRLLTTAPAPALETGSVRTPTAPVTAADKPLAFRGLMYDTSRSSKIYDVETFIRFVDWLAVCGCTHFMLYFENGFRYQKHPAFAAPEALDAGGVRRIEAACRERGLELILAQTSLGHMPGILSHPNYLHLAENGDPYQICPCHPESYPLLSDMFDELIPLSPSKYFNINCDESRLVGRCPRCRQRGADAKGKEDIFLEHLLWLHAKVSSHGRRMMVWSDHLLAMPAILERLPKDLVVLDWQYCNWLTFPTLSYLHDYGFEVIGCPACRYDNIRPMTLDCRRRGMSGVLDTIWESGYGHLGLSAPGIYQMCKLAQGDPATSDATLLREVEELIWPGNAPGIAWKMLIDQNGSLTPALRAKLQVDTARALRRATPNPRFAWIAEQLRQLVGG